jgi:uncharacterized protein YdiU (UPF0061 family)
MPFTFDNSYARLPRQMFTPMGPTKVAAPALFAVNTDLGAVLGLSAEDLSDPAVFVGNAVPDGAEPLAQLYAGHQFGNWNPQLGDGRAVLLGEVIGTDGIRRDIQLKGSGPTPYSRNGDGRAWLGPVLREYLVSEAMHAMGVPTTRALAAATTGEDVIREEILPGAVLTRVAQSHIRVGTFQIYAARQDKDALQALTDHVIARHYPDADGPAALLDAVIANQAKLIAKWMGLGFIHGVMNTDNASIAGETIDYGPCAFMDGYHPETVFSAIDQFGRYAYQNQPGIAAWNMAQLATSLIPLMPDTDEAIELFTSAVNTLPTLYAVEYRKIFAAKLGVANPTTEIDGLIAELLELMANDGADFTNMFVALAEGKGKDHILDQTAFAAWHARWQAYVPDISLMARSNPQIIPRNHRVEEAIVAARDGDYAPFNRLLAAVTAPFDPLTDKTRDLARAPAGEDRVLRTFCGT